MTDKNTKTVTKTPEGDALVKIPTEAAPTLVQVDTPEDAAELAMTTGAPSTKEAKAFRKALDNLFETARDWKAKNPGVTSFVADSKFKVEFAGPELFSVHR